MTLVLRASGRRRRTSKGNVQQQSLRAAFAPRIFAELFGKCQQNFPNSRQGGNRLLAWDRTHMRLATHIISTAGIQAGKGR